MLIHGGRIPQISLGTHARIAAGSAHTAASFASFAVCAGARQAAARSAPGVDPARVAPREVGIPRRLVLLKRTTSLLATLIALKPVPLVVTAVLLGIIAIKLGPKETRSLTSPLVSPLVRPHG